MARQPDTTTPYVFLSYASVERDRAVADALEAAGGTGKTRLALSAAASQTAAFLADDAIEFGLAVVAELQQRFATATATVDYGQ